ncbi:MAG TPA: hypothetical protein VJ836_04905 [Candidatus Saccharimonadales bacterium]|nr:hypothetical protein [Candidatus Saccharimonadales bacterium]
MDPSTTSTEYELTYLAREIPAEVRSAMPIRLVDVYIPDDRNVSPCLRLRKKGHNYEITKKLAVSNADYSVHAEQTIALTQAEFESLAVGHTRLVEKDRYAVTIAGRAGEVDIFSGRLEGLVLIDFEFENEQAMRDFKPPFCCLVNVTQQLLTRGGELAGKSYTEIADDLEAQGYRHLTF